ncbi:MAG: PspC domain-containing protein [Gaiellaceae bacterium]
MAEFCAGLGRYFDVNPLVYRIAFAALLGMLTLPGSAAEAVSGKT